jgi:hypothetical protein
MESKQISERHNDFPDIKEFIAKNSQQDSTVIQRFVDINNILSYDDKNTVFIQIPWDYDKKNNKFRYSELSFKSDNLKNKEDVVNIFFIFDMSNTDILKISSSYYIKGKNLEITFQSENKALRDMIDSVKHELKEKLELSGLNVWIKTLNPQTDKKKILNTTKDTGGIDIKA